MHINPLHRILTLAALAALALATPQPPIAAAQGPGATPTATARPNERPDACEPNPDARRACVLALDAVSGPFTLLPEGDQDYYSLFLGERADGRVTEVTVRATSGLDLRTTITRADDGAPLGIIAGPAISTTLAVDTAGWVVLRVENRAPGMALGESYRIEARKTLPPPPAATPPPAGPDGLERAPAAPDLLENNYSPETATPIGVGVVYELNFVCPVADGCAGGDHDYLRFEVKAGTRYLLSTFDLAPGVDTVIDLLWWRPEGGWQLLATNDDERPGVALLSTLRWQAPGDGPAILRVAPRTGGLNPILVGRESRPLYRVAVALAGSGLAAQLEERIAQQTGGAPPVATGAAPTTDPPPAGATDAGGAPAQPAAPTPMPIVAGAPVGLAVSLAEPAPVTIAPEPGSAILADLPAGSRLTTTGMVSGLYAEVTGATFVGAGWVNRRLLRPAQGPAGDDGPATPVPAGDDAPTADPRPTQAAIAPGDGLALVVKALDPLPLPPLPGAAAPIPVQLTVSVRTAGGQPVSGVRLALTNRFGDIYVETITGPDGTAQLSAAVPPGAALVLLAPVAGIQQRIGGDTADLAIIVPEVGQ